MPQKPAPPLPHPDEFCRRPIELVRAGESLPQRSVRAISVPFPAPPDFRAAPSLARNAR